MEHPISATQIQVSKDIFPNEAWELISKNKRDGDLTIIDVSTPIEYRSLHLEGALNVNLFSRLFKTRLDTMEKSRTYIVYCKVGGRSKIARKVMKKLGFQRVYNIIGGTLLWGEEGLPFASGTNGANRFSFCPFLILIVTVRKIKGVLNNAVSRVVQRKGIENSSGQASYPSSQTLRR